MNNEERKQEIEAREAATPSLEAEERKACSMVRLTEMGVPVIVHLPVIEDESELTLRSVEDIAHRAVAVFLTAVKGEGQEQEEVEREIAVFGAADFFTPAEAAFIADLAPGDRARIQFSWRYECVCILMWSLGFLYELPEPSTICNVAGMAAFLRHLGTGGLVANAQPKSAGEILDQADFIYRAHWAVTNARLKGAETPADLIPGVVFERHYALNWLIRYMGQEWDEISTDT